ncbi:MAG: ABC transporter substrate-binding protein [Anaerolineales bacterium]|nr:ABC transporter substrate-binding protein [Anaerolineales bacterium]
MLSNRSIPFLLLLCLMFGLLAGCNRSEQESPYRIGVLLSGDIRLEPFAGLKDGLEALGYVEGEHVVFEVMNAEGDRQKLSELAEAIVISQPDLAIAGGGIEADALKAATEGSDLPVVFLSVSSAIDRGLVESLRSSGNNLAGIETNDTQLTAKRLELITQIMPGAKKVHILLVPSITPGVKSAQVAEQIAPGLGLELIIISVETEQDIQEAAANISRDEVDAMLILPLAPVWQAMKDVLYPVSVEQGIPIFGVNRDDLERGAIVSYAGSRYANGFQAARLVDKILLGVKPADIPIETPQRLEFIINRSVANRIGVAIPDEMLGLADEVVEIEVSSTR